MFYFFKFQESDLRYVTYGVSKSRSKKLAQILEITSQLRWVWNNDFYLKNIAF